MFKYIWVDNLIIVKSKIVCHAKIVYENVYHAKIVFKEWEGKRVKTRE